MIKQFLIKGINSGKIFCLMLILFARSVFSFAEGESNEYNIKAMFILNFIKYIEWPLETNSEKITIGVFDDSEIYNSLLNMSNNRNDGHKIKIEKIKNDITENFQIIVIGQDGCKKLEELEKKFQGKGVLFISDDCKLPACGAINLKNIDNKIRFEINNSQAKSEGIKISSRLMELAITVYP